MLNEILKKMWKMTSAEIKSNIKEQEIFYILIKSAFKTLNL